MNGTVLITGAASGIGKQLALSLQNSATKVIATDLNEEGLKNLEAESENILCKKLDVTSANQWDELFKWIQQEHPNFNLICNVAGYLSPGWTHELKAEDVDRHLDINVKGVIHGTRHAATHWVNQGKQGQIINLASMAALAPIPGLSLYSASKFAVRAFSIAAAQELREKKISVSVVCPDAVQTPMLDRQKNEASAALTFSGGRILTVDEVVEAIIERVIPEKPIEVFLPPERGWLARFADVFPSVATRISPYLRKKGLSKQAEFNS